MGGASAPPNFSFFSFLHRPVFLKHGQLCTGLNKGFLKLNNSTIQLASQSSIDTLNTEVNNLKSSVSNGKSLIAAAVTDKGVPTAASDSFTTMSNNIRNIQIGGILNIVCSDSQPNIQNGIWIKKNPAEVNKINIKSDYYIPDGTIEPINNLLPENCMSCWGGYINGLFYINSGYQGSSYGFTTRSTGFIYDTKTKIITTVNNISPGNRQTTGNNNNPSFVYDNKLYQHVTVCDSRYTYSHKNDFIILDPNTNTYTTKQFSTARGNNIQGTWKEGNFVYSKDYIYTSSGSSNNKIVIDKYDLISDTYTNFISVNCRDATTPTSLFIYDNKIYLLDDSICIFGKIDMSSKILTLCSPMIPLSDKYSYGSVSWFKLFNYIYNVGTKSSADTTEAFYGEAKRISIFDLNTEIYTYSDLTLPSSQARSLAYGSVNSYVDGVLYIGGGAYVNSQSSYTGVRYITEYHLDTHLYDNNNVYCMPTIYDNTEIYNDSTASLNLGISDIYYQSNDGFKKISGAIIKNGNIIKDI